MATSLTSESFQPSSEASFHDGDAKEAIDADCFKTKEKHGRQRRDKFFTDCSSAH